MWHANLVRTYSGHSHFGGRRWRLNRSNFDAVKGLVHKTLLRNEEVHRRKTSVWSVEQTAITLYKPTGDSWMGQALCRKPLLFLPHFAPLWISWHHQITTSIPFSSLLTLLGGMTGPSFWRPIRGLWPFKLFVSRHFYWGGSWLVSLALSSLQWACAAVNPRTVNHGALYRRGLRLRCLRSPTPSTRRTRGRASEWPTNWHTTQETQTNTQQTPPRHPHLSPSVRQSVCLLTGRRQARATTSALLLLVAPALLLSALHSGACQPPARLWRLGLTSSSSRVRTWMNGDSRASSPIRFLLRRWRHRSFRKF